MKQELLIKNMVCPRCIKVVSEELSNAGLTVISVTLGKAIVENEDVSLPVIRMILQKNGFQLIEDKNMALVEQVKTLLIEKIQTENSLLKFKLTEYLEQELGKKYTYISRIFSRIKGKTIERYFIELRIEKVKELIEYGEFTFSEIAYKLGYNGLQHLSTQFRSTTGMSMSSYKEEHNNKRSFIDKL